MRPSIVVRIRSTDTRADVLRELERRYGADYAIGTEAGDGPVALLLADADTDDEVYLDARRRDPDVRRGMLIEWGAWADPAVSAVIRRRMAAGVIDYYVVRPRRPPDESFHRSIGEFLLERQRASAPVSAVLVSGPDSSPRSHEIRGLLARTGIPSVFEAGEAPPRVRLADGRILTEPSNAELVEAFGLETGLPERTVDLAIVGAGPGGLAAAVYAASEGLDAVVLEQDAVGGQAGSSSLIRNYLGFSRGVSGADLAQRAFQQAWVFGAHFAHARAAVGMRIGDEFELVVGDGVLTARAVVLATGVSYRRLPLGALGDFVGASVFYGASAVEAQGQAGRTVHVIGGGNSAGQAALHLARYARRVSLVIRGSAVAESMSEYLVAELAAAGVEVLTERELVGGGSSAPGGRLDHILLRHRASGEEESVPSDAVFITIGAKPRTGWLPDAVLRDRWGSILTGQDVLPAWPLERAPTPYETSVPGVFAIGDTRRGALRRVAAAVGEGSVVISAVHGFLAERAAGR